MSDDEWDDPIIRDIARDVRRGHIPCCMGCAVYGHPRCTCTPVARRTVDVPLLVLKRVLDGNEKPTDRSKLAALVAQELRS